MQILVATEKHYTDYWDASTQEALAASSLAILKQRFEEGYWYYRYEPKILTPDTAPKRADQSQEEWLAKIEKSNAKEQRTADRENEWYDEVEKLVKGEIPNHTVTIGANKFARKMPLSWWLLSQRADYEYERVELETVRTG